MMSPFNCACSKRTFQNQKVCSNGDRSTPGTGLQSAQGVSTMLKLSGL